MKKQEEKETNATTNADFDVNTTTSEIGLDELYEEHRRLSLLLTSIQSDVDSISKSAPPRSKRFTSSKRKTTHEESEVESVTTAMSQVLSISDDYEDGEKNGLTSVNKTRSKTRGSQKKSSNRMNTIMEVNDYEGENDVIMIKVADKKMSGTVKNMLTKANNIYMVSTRDPTKFVRLENLQDVMDEPRIEYKNVNESLKALTNIEELEPDELNESGFVLHPNMKIIDTTKPFVLNSSDAQKVSEKVMQAMNAIKSHLGQSPSTSKDTYICKKRLSSEVIIDDVLNNENLKTSSITLYPENVASVRNNVIQRIKSRGYRSIRHVGSEKTRYEKIVDRNSSENNENITEIEKGEKSKGNTKFLSEKIWRPSFSSLKQNQSSTDTPVTSDQLDGDNSASEGGIFERPDTPYCHNDVIDDLMTRRNEIVFSYHKNNAKNENERMDTTESKSSDTKIDESILNNENEPNNDGNSPIIDSSESGMASFLDRDSITSDNSSDFKMHTYVNLAIDEEFQNGNVAATGNDGSREHSVLNEIAMIEKQISDISSGLNLLELEIPNESEKEEQKEKTIIQIWEEQEQQQKLQLLLEQHSNKEDKVGGEEDEDESDKEDSRRIEQLYHEIEQHQLKQQRLRLEQEQRQQQLQQRIQQRNQHYQHQQHQNQSPCQCRHYECRRYSEDESTDDSNEIIDGQCTIREDDYNSNNSDLRSCLKGTRRKYSASSTPDNNELSVKIATHHKCDNHHEFPMEKLDSAVRYVANSNNVKKMRNQYPIIRTQSPTIRTQSPTVRTQSPTVRNQSPNPNRTNNNKARNNTKQQRQQQNSNKRFKPTTKENTKKQNRQNNNNKSIRRCWCCGSTAHFLKACPQRRQNVRVNAHGNVNCNVNGNNNHNQCKMNNRNIEQYADYNGYYINQPYF